MLRRFTALVLAVSLALTSAPPVFAGPGTSVSTPVSGTPTGPVNAGVTPVVGGARVDGAPTGSGNHLNASHPNAAFHRSGFAVSNGNDTTKGLASPTPAAVPAATPPNGRGNLDTRPEIYTSPVGGGGREAAGGGDTITGESGRAIDQKPSFVSLRVLRVLSGELSVVPPTDKTSAKDHLDKAFSNLNPGNDPTTGPGVGIGVGLGHRQRTPLPLKPQGSGWFTNRNRMSEPTTPAPGDGTAPTPVPGAKISYDYARMFDLARRTLTRKEARHFIKEAFAEELTLTEEQQKKYQLPEKIVEMSQAQFLLLLQNNPKHFDLLEQYLTEMEKWDDKKDSEKSKESRKEWNAKFRALLADKDLVAKFKKLNDPLEPFYLEWKDGSPGYKVEGHWANHASIVDGKEVPASDLKKVALDFIAGAKKTLLVNVFDFDLQDVADAMIERANAGVKVTVGIDKNTMESRPEVKSVFAKLSKVKNLTAVAVDSVALNHQKMMVRDHESEDDARTLFSSGNLTQSCIGPEGDLVDGKPVPGVSAPNANHMIVLSGFLVAQAAADSLIKTLEYKLRGIEYPLGGAFQLQGPPTPDKRNPTLTMAFSPKGGLGDINRDITRRVLLESKGPVRLLQFAFSSESLFQAIVDRAKAAKKDGKDFDFKSIGDTPFALRDWSVFLRLSGWELKTKKDGTKEYVETKDNPLRDALGKELYEKVIKDIRIAPEIYREHHVKDAKGEDVSVNAKLHHKVLVSGDLVIAGTSFNFSENANSNNEQFLLFNDPEMAAWMTGVFDGLFAKTQTSVSDAAVERNEWLKKGGKDKDDDSETKSVDLEARLLGVRPDGANGMSASGDKGPSDLQKEFVRKIFHQALLGYLGAYHLLGEKTALTAMAVWTAGIVVLETLRLKTQLVRSLFDKVAGGLVREKEANRYTGTLYASLGILAVFFLFGSNPAIVTASILYLAFGDAASALVGRAFGAHKFTVLGQGRSVEGTLAGLAVAVGVGFALGFSPLMIAAGAGAFLFADLVPLPPDDNFWIPVLTGGALWLVGGPIVQSVAATVSMTNIFAVLALGFLLGMRHATDSDHVAAVATIVSRSKKMGTAWLLGAFWGLGHTATLFAVGTAIILLKVAIPAHISLGMEFAVAGVLALLGAANIAGFFTGSGRTEAHEHGSEPPHMHTEEAGWLKTTLKDAGWAQVTRSTGVGLMHGLAGSAAVALLTLATIPEPVAAMVYLTVFGAGTLAGMLTLSALMEYSMFKLTRWWKPGERAFIVLTGLISLTYGSWLMVHLASQF